MTAIPQPNSTRMVSERILTPLQQVARRQWSVLAARGVGSSNTACYWSLRPLIAAAIAARRRSDIAAHVPAPVQ